MIKTFFNAKVKWIDHNAGGRINKPCLGARYYPIIRISDNEHWSIDCICPDFEITDLMVFTMFSDLAPTERILENTYYGLYEGNNRVAEVFIISRYEKEV